MTQELLLLDLVSHGGGGAAPNKKKTFDAPRRHRW
jgi:hypothetical protein